jgi:internalin A
LYSLDCSHTQVSELKPLQHVPALQVLDCSGTLVSDLTPLVWVEKLSYVAASRCPLSDLPLSLVRTRTITWLGLHGIAVPGLPVEVLSVEPYSNCLAQLRDHLDDLRAGEEQVRVAKLVVVGNGRVGKTQLCRRLRGLKYDDTVPSTHGITVTSENSNSSADTDTLNIWDFGGQDIYHGVHTLFMKTRAVFLVVWHPDFEAGDEASDSLSATLLAGLCPYTRAYRLPHSGSAKPL